MSALPDPWKTLSGRLKKLEEKVRALSNSSSFTGTGWTVVDTGQVSQGGSVTIPQDGVLIVDGGDVVMLDKAPLATTLFRLGTQEYGDRGLTLRRQDGTLAVEIRKIFGPSDSNQALVIRDRQGGRIGGDALLSPAGFDAPHLHMPFVPVDPTSPGLAVTTSSAAFVATHEYYGYRQNPALKPLFKVKCSDAITAAEIRIYNVTNAVYLGGFLGSPAVQTITVPAGTTAYTVLGLASGAMVLPGSMSAALQFEVHVRVTAGTGSVTVAPVRTISGPV